MNSQAHSFIDFYQNFFPINDSTLKAEIKIKVIILAPHPDDECLMASLALRLKIENKAEVLAVAVTLGSNEKRRSERTLEFNDSCQVLGFEPYLIASDDWKDKENFISQIITDKSINLIIAPHLNDHHPAHIKTSRLARKIISDTAFNGVLLESEFWGELPSPNLLIEVTKDVFTLEFNALTKHQGEITRNPYHLRLAANLVNNVRLGAEKVQALGESSPDFAFGNLYQLYQVKDGVPTLVPPQILDYQSDLSLIF